MILLKNMKYAALAAGLAVTLLGASWQTAMAQDNAAPVIVTPGAAATPESAPAAPADDGLMPPQAQGFVTVDSQFSPEGETHPPMRLTPDKSEIISLNEEIERVIIGNDAHVNIMMDTTKRLVVVPRLPGATYFTLLGPNGKIVMQRYVIVSSPQEKYVRLRNPCTSANRDGEALDRCLPMRVYYCPDMCHEIALVGEDGEARSSNSAYVTTSEEEGQQPLNAEQLPTQNQAPSAEDGGGEGGEE